MSYTPTTNFDYNALSLSPWGGNEKAFHSRTRSS